MHPHHLHGKRHSGKFLNFSAQNVISMWNVILLLKEMVESVSFSYLNGKNFMTTYKLHMLMKLVWGPIPASHIICKGSKPICLLLSILGTVSWKLEISPTDCCAENFVFQSLILFFSKLIADFQRSFHFQEQPFLKEIQSHSIWWVAVINYSLLNVRGVLRRWNGPSALSASFKGFLSRTLKMCTAL